MKLVARLVVLIMMIALCAVPATADSVRVYAADNTVRCYSGASYSASQVATLGYGEDVTCIGIDGEWALVKADSGAQAYCRVDELTTDDPNCGSLTAYVVNGGAKAYSRPGHSYRSVNVAGEMKLTVVALTPDRKWCRVKSGNVYAYMPASALTTEKPAGDKPAASAKPITVYAADEVVYIYSEPTRSSARTDTAGYGEKLTCSAVDGSWAKVSSGSKTGWCYTEKLTRTDPNTASLIIYAKNDSVKAYSLPDASASVLCSLSPATALKCVAATPDGVWLRVTANGKYGYVRKADMTTSKPDKIDKLIALAMAQLDKPYVYATRGPSTYDCAGLTLYCYREIANITLGRSAQLQGYNERFTKIESISELRRGDLVCFNTVEDDSDLTDHVGIYLGDGKFIHASSEGGKVMISSLSVGFYNRVFSWGRRLII